MKRFAVILLVLIVLSSIFTMTAFAKGSPPVGGCATGFGLMPVMNGDPMNMHIGLNQDLNGNGFVCMKMVTPDKCVIVDDVVP